MLSATLLNFELIKIIINYFDELFLNKQLAHGLIAKIINSIPNSMFIKELKFSFVFIMPTENIIMGILKIITIGRQAVNLL